METKKVILPNRVSYIPKDETSISKRINEFGVVPTLSRLSTDPLDAYLQEAVITAKNRKEYMENNKHAKVGKTISKDSSARLHSRSAARNSASRVCSVIKEESLKQNDYKAVKEGSPKSKRPISKKEFHPIKDRVELLRAESRRLFEKDMAKLSLRDGHEHTSSRGGSPEIPDDLKKSDLSYKENYYNVHETALGAQTKDEIYKYDRSKLRDDLCVQHHRSRDDTSKLHHRRSSKEDARKINNRSAKEGAAIKHDRISVIHKDISLTKSKVRSATRDDVTQVQLRSATKTESSRTKRVSKDDTKKVPARPSSKEITHKVHERLVKDEEHYHRENSGKDRSVRSGRRTRSSKDDVGKFFSKVGIKDEILSGDRCRHREGSAAEDFSQH